MQTVENRYLDQLQEVQTDDMAEFAPLDEDTVACPGCGLELDLFSPHEEDIVADGDDWAHRDCVTT